MALEVAQSISFLLYGASVPLLELAVHWHLWCVGCGICVGYVHGNMIWPIQYFSCPEVWPVPSSSSAYLGIRAAWGVGSVSVMYMVIRYYIRDILRYSHHSIDSAWICDLGFLCSKTPVRRTTPSTGCIFFKDTQPFLPSRRGEHILRRTSSRSTSSCA